MPAAPLIVVDRVSKVYRRGAIDVPVLHDVSLTIAAGEFAALMGPSGSGKTTLLNLLAGIDAPTHGRLTIGGRSPGDMRDGELARWRAETVGFVFQLFNLIPVLTALENVELPLLLTRLGRAERRERAARALRLVGLEDRLDHRPQELSGGQEQRVAIARAIVADPALLLADEPTGDLDAQSAEEVLTLLGRLHRELEKTVVLVTHDAAAAAYADRIVRLEKGTLGAGVAAERGVAR